MSEQEKMDRLLRQSMSATPQPGLSSSFDPRLARRLRPRRLTKTGRIVMILYTLAALAISILAMRSESIHWLVMAAALVLPMMTAATVHFRRS
jgi:hypothetical protein